MKKMTLLRKVLNGFLCTGIAGAFSVTAWAQPTVTVPTGCTVVVEGQGGNAGTGIVGDGGIITMPDPFPNSIPPNCTFTINPGTTNADSWVLSGDLSIYPTAFGDPAIQTATGNTADIMSFNKNVRISESDAQGRSIGIVTIPYDDTLSLCSGGISFKVYKVYSDSLPIIIGPGCWLPDSTYTYSVDQIASDNLADGIGLDMYYWTIVDDNGDTLYNSVQDPLLFPDSYTSADKSSITTKVPSTLISPYTITCCFGRANPWDGDVSPYTHTSCVTKVIGAEPQEPIVLFEDPDTCLVVGANSFDINIDTNDPSYDAAYTYSWSSNNPNWQFTPNTGASTVMASNLGDLGGNPGTIILSVNNPTCGQTKQFEYNVHRSFMDPVVTIVGADDCLVPGGEYAFQINPSTAHNNYTDWTLPTGWTIVNSNPTETIITVAVPSGESVGTYTLSAVSAACPNSSVSLDVYIKPANPVFQTTGGDSPECVDYDASSSVPYTVSSSPGATGYDWTFPSDWTPSSASTALPTVNVTPEGNGTTTGIVSVIALGNGGCNSDPVNYPIGYNAIKPDAIPNDLCWNFGLQGTTTITIDNAPAPFFGDYSVSSNPSGLIVGTPTVNANGEITITTSASASGSYDLIIEHVTTTNCGPQSETFSINVVGNGSFITPLYNQGMADIFIANVFAPGASFIWALLNANGDVISNPTPPSPGVLTLSGSNTPPAQVCIDVTLNGCVTRYCVPGGTYSESIVHPGGNSAHRLNDRITVYPNPTAGTFNIDLANVKEAADLQLFDAQGRLINTHTLSNGKNTITEDISSGTYLLLINVDGEFSAHKIEVNSGK